MNSSSDFIHTVQKFVARESVTPSAMRNQGQGVLHAIHDFLDQLNLSVIADFDQSAYLKWLDGQTVRLLEALPLKMKPWGAARKALNLFMRTALYNRYLSEAFKLSGIEAWMEIPLDGAVSRGLKKVSSHGGLPQWPGLKRLNPPISEQYQLVARNLAAQRDFATVHLDMYLWMENR